jgi:hypothetical protein
VEREDCWCLQDADGWRLVGAVWDWSSAAGGVVGDLGGECGRHVVVVIVGFVVFDLGVSGMKLSRTDKSWSKDGEGSMRSLKDDRRMLSLEYAALKSWFKEGMRLAVCVVVSSVSGERWEVKWTRGGLDDSKGGAGPRRLEVVHQ